jgi:hypothetical protein
MADITAAQITNKYHGQMGPLKVWFAKVQGDGSGVTIPTPFSRIVNVQCYNIDDTSAIPAISSTSGGTITYASAPTSTKYHYLMVVGI